MMCAHQYIAEERRGDTLLRVITLSEPVDPPAFRPHSDFGPVLNTDPLQLGCNSSHPSATLRDSIHPSSLSHLLLISRDPALPSTSDSRQSPLASRPSNSYPILTPLPPARSTLMTSRSTSRLRPLPPSSGPKPKPTPEFPRPIPPQSFRPPRRPAINAP